MIESLEHRPLGKQKIDPGTDAALAPAGYPGQRLSCSSLLVGDCLHELRPTALRRLGEAPVDERYAVLATGSNMSPATIHRKLQSVRNPARTVVPMLRCWAYGLGNGY